ncbi:hypothetical protein FRB94_002287 [Tulasnella sp. JGI-2019a]|nr:hypothetical protein FRB93_004427 [Tulasnella sp. JGI-2019a]KAG9004546.1 hypothetical protein FRB94_002287 [Tulasnella sp. JGI-2019a]
MFQDFVKLGRVAIQAIKNVKPSRSNVQKKVKKMIENSAPGGSVFVNFTECCELAQLSFEEFSFCQITQALDCALRDSRGKWRTVTKALMLLNHCLQEGSSRFEDYCRQNLPLLLQLESFDYIFEDGRDCGIEVRREARKIVGMLFDPTMLTSIRAPSQCLTYPTTTPNLSPNHSMRLCRRGALMRTNNHPRNANSSWDIITPFVSPYPASISPDWEAVVEAMKAIVGLTTSAHEFLEILAALVERLITDGYCLNYPEVLEALALTRIHLTNVPETLHEYMGNLGVGSQYSQDCGDAAEVTSAIGVLAQICDTTLQRANAEELVDLEGVEELATQLQDDNPGDWSPKNEDYYSETDNSVTWSMDFNDGSASLLSIEEEVWANEKAYNIATQSPRMLAGNTLSDGSDVSSLLSSDTHFLDPPPYQTGNQEALESPITPLTPPDDKEDSEDQTRYAFAALLAPARSAGSPSAPTRSSELSTPVRGDNELSSLAEKFGSTQLRSRRPLPHAPIFQTPCHSEALPVYSPVDDSPRIHPVPTHPGPPDGQQSPESSDQQGTVLERGSAACSNSDRNGSGSSLAGNTSSSVVTCSTSPTGPKRSATWPGVTAGDLAPTPSDTLPTPITLQRMDNNAARPRLSVVIPSPVVPESLANVPTPDSPASPVKCLTGSVIRVGGQPYAQGGFSDVWRGNIKDEEGRLVQEVAVKVLRAVKMRPDDTASGRLQKRMHREIKIWHGLQHPGIVPLLGYALELDGAPSLISPWYGNGDVVNYLKRHPFADRRKIVRQITEGLAYLHSQNPPVIHGDLKGANVLIDQNFDAALCDFGLAKLLQDCPSSFTTSNVGMGTLRWCSPELLLEGCENKTQASDVWAFAALALEIFTGHIPFYDKSNTQATVAIARGEIPARALYPELPQCNKFWDVLESCWKQDPTERPTMEALGRMILNDDVFSAS